ncbi:MAG: response regulator transcription factor [Verrucomicrobia bacterium]|nr:response regulator transcription factor [Verrucomicrobiota bacterium]
MRILYVEDSSSLRETIGRGLKNAGYIVTLAADGISGLDAALEAEHDVIIIDVMLPGMDGFEMLGELKKAEVDSQILMLTARASIEDRVHGLESGADDYLVKPFAWKELLARVRNLIRHRYGQQSSSLSIGDLKIDTQAQRIWYKNKELRMRPREFSILEYLALRVGKIVSRTELTEHLYDHAVDLKSNAIDSAICNIRKKLTLEGCDEIISTIPRRGYLMESRTSKS